jgi:hypothetical protein
MFLVHSFLCTSGRIILGLLYAIVTGGPVDRWSIDDAYDDAMMSRIDPKDK